MKPKLIRDKIPDDMRAHGYEPSIAYARHPETLRAYLLAKLQEECNEVILSCGRDVSELADVWEVIGTLGALLSAEGHPGNIIEAADAKRERRGGFIRGTIWLNSDDQSPEAIAATAQYRRAESQPPDDAGKHSEPAVEDFIEPEFLG